MALLSFIAVKLLLRKMPSSQTYRNAKGRRTNLHPSTHITREQRMTGTLTNMTPTPLLNLSSTNRSMRPKKRPHAKWRSHYEKLFTDWWLWEILAIVLSISSFAALVVVLGICDGHAVPQFPLGTSLNGVISILAVITKTSMLFSISATMSQFKWLTFSSLTHQLKGLQLYDQASRGPLGASMLLVSEKGRSVTASSYFPI